MPRNVLSDANYSVKIIYDSEKTLKPFKPEARDIILDKLWWFGGVSHKRTY